MSLAQSILQAVDWDVEHLRGGLTMVVGFAPMGFARYFSGEISWNSPVYLWISVAAAAIVFLLFMWRTVVHAKREFHRLYGASETKHGQQAISNGKQ